MQIVTALLKLGLPLLALAAAAATPALAAAPAKASPAAAARASAEPIPYPEQPITLIVPQAAGGANDAIARIVAPRLAALLGQAVSVQNRAGGGGNVGTVEAAKASADGYTLMLTTNSAHVINPWLYKNAGFDPIKDFVPIATVATAGYVLVAHPGFAPNNVAQLVAYVRSRPPGSVAYASSGNGTLNHLVVEMLKKTSGIEMTHVPFRSAAAAAAEVAAGQLQLSAQSVPSALALIRGGQLKVLGTVNEKRIAALPQVPTIGETLPGFGSTPWYGLFAPAGTPQPIVAKLQAAMVQVLASPEVAEQLSAQGCEPMRTTAARFAALIRSDLASWGRIVKDSKATLD